MPNELKIVIDADVQKAVNSFKKFEGGVTVLQNQLIRLQKIASSTDLSFKNQERVAGLINKTNAELAKFARASEVTVNSVRKFNQTSGQSVQVLSNLSRVAQDAPFGFLGIANNINPLIESFQRLQSASKATGTSLTSSLGAALSGPAGIGLGIGIVSSLLIQFGDNLFSSAKGVSALDVEIGLLSSSIKRSKEDLKDFNKQLEFLRSSQDIKIEIGTTDTGDIALKKIREDITFTGKEITRISSDIDNAFAQSKSARDAFFESLSSNQLSSLSAFSLVQDIPENIVEGFSKSQQLLFKGAKESTENLVDLQSQLTGALNKQSLNRQRILLQETLNQRKELEEQKANFEKFVNATIARAKQFNKEFGDSFVVPDLEESFFVNKNEIFKRAKDFLKNFDAGGQLKIKLPVFIEPELLPEPTGILGKQFNGKNIFISDAEFEKIRENFKKSIEEGLKIPIEVSPDLSLSKGSLESIEKKLQLRQGFSILGDLGLKEFNKIDFSNINKGIAEATKRLEGMMAIATTLNQAIGQGLVNSFNAVFDAILEGKNVFKALGNALKELVANTIKAVAQMLILKAITNIIFSGGGGAIQSILPRGFTPTANFGGLSGIGSRAFNNVIQITGGARIAGNDIVLSYSRTTNSNRTGG